jgi:hypothetical protein
MEWSWEMTTFIEDQLTEGMRERVAGIAVTGDLVGQTLRAQRRHTTVTRTAYAVGVIGLAGALTAGVLTTAGAGPAATPDRPPAAGAQPPQVRLAAAITASRGISYRVKNTIIPRSQPGSPSMVITGAFDPATTTGYLRFASADGTPWSEERLIDGDLYIGDLVHLRPVPTNTAKKPAPSPDERVDWTHDPDKKYTSLPYDDAKSGVLGTVSADPGELFDTLSKSGAKISQTGPDTYHFEVAIVPRSNLRDGKAIGDVTVGSDHRVAKVSYEATMHFATETFVVDETLELSDYGTPVTVERPAGIFESLPGK